MLVEVPESERIENAAKEYETLKLSLWKKYEHDRDAYTYAKTDFISRWTHQSRKEYGNRYQ